VGCRRGWGGIRVMGGLVDRPFFSTSASLDGVRGGPVGWLGRVFCWGRWFCWTPGAGSGGGPLLRYICALPGWSLPGWVAQGSAGRGLDMLTPSTLHIAKPHTNNPPTPSCAPGGRVHGLPRSPGCQLVSVLCLGAGVGGVVGWLERWHIPHTGVFQVGCVRWVGVFSAARAVFASPLAHVGLYLRALVYWPWLCKHKKKTHRPGACTGSPPGDRLPLPPLFCF